MKNCLIIKLSAIGDVVMAMPMVTEIIKKYPKCEITWVCGYSVRCLIEQLPVHNIICVDEKKLLSGNVLEKIVEVVKLWKKIALKKYDVIALGHADKKYQILTLLTRYDKKNRFTHNVGKMWPIPSRHHTDEYVRLVDSDMSNDVILSYQCHNLIYDKEIHELLLEDKPIISLAPGGAKNFLADDSCRRWPIQSYVELAKLLIKDGYTVVITGAPSDIWVVKHFREIPVINLVGRTTLDQLIYIYSQSDIVVAHDSGPMHLAGMTKCNLIALFGPTNAFEKIPRRDGVYLHWLFDKFSCSPCYDGKSYVSCDKNVCMQNIGVKEIYKQIMTIIYKDKL